MEITRIDGHNFSLESLDDFSRYQKVENVYRMVNGILHLVYNPFTESWSQECRREKAKAVLSGKYIAYGAFDGKRVVGLIMLLPQLNMSRMIIDSFHVCANMRRCGIGRALFEAAKNEATRCGAHALYASACSSQETIDFYIAMGFTLSSNPIQSYVNAEPWDIQMECALFANDKKEIAMDQLNYITLRQNYKLADTAAEWFHQKWGVPKDAYLKCMNDYLDGLTEYGWYLCLDGEKIVGGLGVIENDFHDRKDLTPNICAVYTESEYRCKGIAGRLLNMAVDELRTKGISPVYLLTCHTGFYERYGWEFLCMVQGDGEENLSRMYIHR